MPTSLFRSVVAAAVLTASLASPSLAGGPVEVLCNRGESLQTALDGLLVGEVVRIVGNCQENVVVATDHVTIEGVDAYSEINATRGGGLYGHAVTIRSRGVTIDGLTILGGLLVEDGGENRLLDSAVKGDLVAIKVSDGELEIRDSYSAGYVLADRGATVNMYDSKVDGRVQAQGSSFAMLRDTDVYTNDLALAAAGRSFLSVSGGEIESEFALDIHDSTAGLDSGTLITGSLHASRSTVTLGAHVEQVSSSRENEFSWSKLESEYENILLDTALYRLSSASLQQGDSIESLSCHEGSVAYCPAGVVTGTSSCSSCPSP